MRTLSIPSFLHDVLGERQSLRALPMIALGAVAAGGGIAAAAWSDLGGLPWYRLVPALLLIVDIAAGAVANFSRGTSEYYAARPVNRLVFMAIHVHLPAVALLAGLPLWPALLVWAWTISGAFAVNALKGNAEQPLAGGFVLVVGMTGAVLLFSMVPWFLATALLFLAKVAYSFAVDHYRGMNHQEEGRE